MSNNNKNTKKYEIKNTCDYLSVLGLLPGKTKQVKEITTQMKKLQMLKLIHIKEINNVTSNNIIINKNKTKDEDDT